ncbi:MAG: phosphate uptake regulator PhoU [Candidatus Caldarchaeum sp.]|nr:phosphate uptake regulator PhoU [Candidatus Caldarchaeum sp.]
MENVYIRRIQKTGRSTYIVSLPREWVEKTGLKKFDAVKIVPFASGLLILGRNGEGRGETILNVSSYENPDELVRLFFSKYLDGYDRIRVTFSAHSPQVVGVLKDRVRRWLVGVEIIGETTSEILAQVLPVSDTLPVRSSLERMGSITHHMLQDAVTAVTNLDRELAEDVIRRDDEVDRFYHFVTRQLNIAVRDYSMLQSLQLSDPSECINYVLAGKSIERAADHAVTISKRALSTEHRKKIDRKINEISDSVVALFRSSLQALLDTDISRANQVLSSIETLTTEIEHFNTMTRKGEELEERTTYLIVMNSIRRVSEYAADISEAAINIASRKLAT